MKLPTPPLLLFLAQCRGLCDASDSIMGTTIRESLSFNKLQIKGKQYLIFSKIKKKKGFFKKNTKLSIPQIRYIMTTSNNLLRIDKNNKVKGLTL